MDSKFELMSHSPGFEQQARLGEHLRHAREHKKFSQKEVARALYLQPSVIDALEREDFASLPGMVYAKGYLRSYAEFLQISHTPIFAELYETQQVNVISPKRLPTANTPSSVFWVGALVGKLMSKGIHYFVILIAGLILYLAWHERYHAMQVNQSDLLFKHLSEQVIPFQIQKNIDEMDSSTHWNSRDYHQLMEDIQPWNILNTWNSWNSWKNT